MKASQFCLFAILFILFLPCGHAQTGTYSETIITPDMERGVEEIRQRFTVFGTSFTTYLVADALYDLSVRDEAGGLRYRLEKPILFGKRRYTPITVELNGGRSEFEISYVRESSSIGTAISGEYWYYLKRTTDVAVVEYRIPQDVRIKTDTEPKPESVKNGNPTVVTYRITEGDMVKLTTRYIQWRGIDYKDTKTTEEKVPVGGKEYTFILSYPKDAEVMAQDVRHFIFDMFPRLMEITGCPLKKNQFNINLKEKGEQEWWAAVNRGGGTIEFFIETPHGYPSTILGHELIHSYIGGIPTFINEGFASYFEGKLYSEFSKSLGYPSYFPPEMYWQTYERQYEEFVDIRTDYGQSGTDRLESLISSKYDKGTYLIYLIERKAGEDTVREMFRIIAERSENSTGPITLDYIVSHLSKNKEIVYDILTDPTFGFYISDPRKDEMLRLLYDMRGDSWWGALVTLLFDYEGKIKTAGFDEMDDLREDIEKHRDFTRKTLVVVDVLLLAFFIVGTAIATKSFLDFRRKGVIHLEEDNLILTKLKLVQKFGTKKSYEEEIAIRYGLENITNEEVIKRFARELGIE